MTQAERDRLDAVYLDRGDLEQAVEQQARHWLTQYSKVLGRTFEVDPVEARHLRGPVGHANGDAAATDQRHEA